MKRLVLLALFLGGCAATQPAPTPIVITVEVTRVVTATPVPTATNTPEPTPTSTPVVTPTPDMGSDAGAWIACKRFVADLLAAPSEAVFPAYWDAKVSGGNGFHVVRAYVDAPNRFGVKLRANWYCKVQYTDGVYDPVDVRVLQ